MTAKHAKVLIDSKYWDRNLSFVAFTRHKESLKIYTDTINHASQAELVNTLSRRSIRDNVIDWPLYFSIRAGFNPDKLIGKVVNHLAGIGHGIKAWFNYVFNYESHLISAQQKSRAQATSMVRKAAGNDDSQHYQRMYKTMRSKYPALVQYDGLAMQRMHLTGYYREKTEKQMKDTGINLMADKKLMAQLQQTLPEMASHIVNFVHSSFKKDLGRDQ